MCHYGGQFQNLLPPIPPIVCPHLGEVLTLVAGWRGRRAAVAEPRGFMRAPVVPTPVGLTVLADASHLDASLADELVEIAPEFA